MDERIVLTNVAMARAGRVLVVCLGENDLMDPEVDQMVVRFAKRDFEVMLFAARGPGPNSKQRAKIADYWKKATPGGKSPRSVVLTDSAAARFVTQAFSWLLGIDTRCFPTREVANGVEHLGMSASLPEVERTIDALHSALEFKQRRVG